MKPNTLIIMGLTLISAVSISSAARAAEVQSQKIIFIPDESNHQQVNERNGQVGFLAVSGTLVTSPCTLKTQETSWTPVVGGVVPVNLTLTGCGEGGVTSEDNAAPIHVIRSALLKDSVDGEEPMYPELQLPEEAVALRPGDNQLTYKLSQHMLLQGALLRLSLEYE